MNAKIITDDIQGSVIFGHPLILGISSFFKNTNLRIQNIISHITNLFLKSIQPLH